jgi:hypothetical protein
MYRKMSDRFTAPGEGGEEIQLDWVGPTTNALRAQFQFYKWLIINHLFSADTRVPLLFHRSFTLRGLSYVGSLRHQTASKGGAECRLRRTGLIL